MIYCSRYFIRGQEMEISNSIKKRFAKDFRLPINVFAEPYFTYFVELYEPLYAIKEKVQWLEKAIEKTGGVEPFFKTAEQIATTMKERIKGTEAYEKFNQADMNKDFPLIEQVKQQNIYIVPNIDKELISIDLEKANFNCLDLFGMKKDLGVSSYNELMAQITDLEYFQNSKMIRQVIFGDLNPARQQRVQKYIINQLCVELKKAGCELSSASSDEIIIANKNNIEEIKSILTNVDEKFKFFRVEKFSFTPVAPETDFFVKTTQTENGDKIEFKNVPGHLFAQVYQKYLGQNATEYDKLFYHEGFLAVFKDPLFSSEPAKKLKP